MVSGHSAKPQPSAASLLVEAKRTHYDRQKTYLPLRACGKTTLRSPAAGTVYPLHYLASIPATHRPKRKSKTSIADGAQSDSILMAVDGSWLSGRARQIIIVRGVLA